MNYLGKISQDKKQYLQGLENKNGEKRNNIMKCADYHINNLPGNIKVCLICMQTGIEMEKILTDGAKTFSIYN